MYSVLLSTKTSRFVKAQSKAHPIEKYLNKIFKDNIMVLEGFVDLIKPENKPLKLIIFGIMLSSVGSFLGLWIFRSYASLVMVFLISIGGLPLVYSIIKKEEEKDLTDLEEKALLKEHGKALMVFMYLFIGVTFGLAFWYTVLPGGTASALFEAQISTLNTINPNSIQGHVSGQITGMVSGKLRVLADIFFNNLKVFVFCMLFSFIYGSGAIFILMWNASVIGTAIGNILRSGIAEAATLIGASATAKYFSVFLTGFFRYAIHGIPEILAYFTAGLAGGIISIAVIRHDFGSRKFEHIVLDSADLLILSLILLFVAALLEVFVTPLIF